jgi:hypothetical protein
MAFIVSMPAFNKFGFEGLAGQILDLMWHERAFSQPMMLQTPRFM